MLSDIISVVFGGIVGSIVSAFGSLSSWFLVSIRIFNIS